MKKTGTAVLFRLILRLIRFFYSEDAYTFRGLATTALILFGGVLGVLTSLKILAKPPQLTVEVRRAISCVSYDQFLREYARGSAGEESLPEALRASMQAVVQRAGFLLLHAPGPDPTTDSLAANEKELTYALLLCWDVRGNWSPIAPQSVRIFGTPREAATETEQVTGTYSNLVLPPAWVINELAVLFHGGAVWPVRDKLREGEREAFLASVGADELVSAIDNARISEEQRSRAYRAIARSRLSVNILSVSNRTNRTSPAANVEVHGRESLKALGGPLRLVDEGWVLRGSVSQFHAGQETWSAFLSRGPPVGDASIQLEYDQTPVVDQVLVGRASWALGVLLGLFLLLNRFARDPALSQWDNWSKRK